MKADVGILCALREHLSYLLSVSTPVAQRDQCWLTEYQGIYLAVGLQGRICDLSHENTRNLIQAFQPEAVYSFGPAAVINEYGPLGEWFEVTRCVHFDQPSFPSELRCARTVTAHRNWQIAGLLVSAARFVADTACIQRLAEQRAEFLTLLDMTGYGVSLACEQAGIPWKHFRWTTDRARDTAVSQFGWNIRTLAKRGSEVVRILEEVLHESSIVV